MDLDTQVARHDEKINDLEERARERRDADGKIFKKLDEINISLNKLQTKTEILWIRTGLIGMVGGAIPAVITLIILILTGKI